MRRNKIELAQSLVEFLHHQDKAFHRTNLEVLGMNSKMAKEWLDLYLIIKAGPDLRVIETTTTTVYEVIRPE